MKLEKVITIEGKVVSKSFKKGSLVVYESEVDSDDVVIIYFVDEKTEEVLFKQTVTAECNQNYGFINNVVFENV